MSSLVTALRRFDSKNGWVMSSHVAMSLMLALFPFVLFTVALAGTLTQDVQLDEMIELVFGGWPEEVADPIVKELYAVLNASGSRLMTLGGLLALYFASNGVNAVRVAMTQAYREVDPRPFWKARLLSLVLVIIGGAGILAITVLELVLPLYTSLLNQAMPNQISDVVAGDWISNLIVLAVPFIAVLACHKWLPGTRHSVRELLPGVILTVVLWGIAGWGFAIYVGSFASYSATYAGLAGAMAALIFLYVNAAILILGAEFNGALLDQKESRNSTEGNSKTRA
jgi:membrane protein